MDATNRYELLNEIARGDFAVVYRARDRELGREVAIKQIHPQYLADTHTLDRFWREAQLLASLEHRSIMTIYDMVRARGWLVLELMPASLQKYARGEPLDLDLLRVTLSCCLQALEYLHANQIIHGDIKPSNLFLDKRSWVKVGDFGLARRVNNEQGSLVKGTTRYMAPELVSPHFGPVGPASDLYSLGFSAYELMCGKEFDTLFPGLDAFGRNKQIAWMMWHAAPDRRLPPIDRVLADVPDDLRLVIQRLTAKNPKERYRRAGEALADLKSRLQLVNADGVPDEESPEAQAEKARRKRRKKIMLTLLGFLMSSALALTLMILNPPEKPTGPPPLPADIHGVVRNLLPDKHTIVIEDTESQAPREITVRDDDQMFLNGQPTLLTDIHERDQLIIKTPARDKRGRDIHDFYATRPERSRGVVAEADPATGHVTVDLEDPPGKKLKLEIPPDLSIRFNNHDLWQGKPFKAADLLPGDRVEVEHDGTDDVRRALALDVARVTPLEGYLRRLDLGRREATFALGREDDVPLETWPLADEVTVTLNGRKLLEGALLKASDLKPGDEVTVEHDKCVVAIDAHRTLRQAGVVQATRPEKHELDLLPAGADRAVTCLVANDTKVRLGGAPAQLVDLHRGDEVKITYDSLDIANSEALTVDAVRQPDSQRWAVVIGEQAFDDRAISPLVFAAADARLVMQSLIGRFQVPQEQSLLLVDNVRALWEESLPGFINRIPAQAQLVVYYVGHGYADKAGKIWLAPRDFTLSKPDATGMALSELVNKFEKCAARDKLFLLDATHAGSGADLKLEPACSTMIESLLQPGALSPVRTITAIASCKPGERGQDSIAEREGRFALALAQGFSGAADRNKDNRLEPVELYEFLTSALSGGPEPQTPVLFLPDDTPPRLAEEAKLAIRKLYGNLLVPRFEAASVEKEYQQAKQLAGKEPEPNMIYGLLLLKAKKDSDSLKIFDELKIERPEDLLPIEAAAWLRFRKQDYNGGSVDILQLLQKLAMPASASPADVRFNTAMAAWAGRLREYAEIIAPENRRPPHALLEQIDTAARQLPDEGRAAYEQGREHVKRVAGQVDREIAATGDNQEKLALEVKRKQLPNYVTFPTEPAAKRVLDGMLK